MALDETGQVPAHVGARALASVRAWARGRPADDARYLEVLRTGAAALGTAAEVTLPRVPAVDADIEGGALHVLLRRDAIYVGVVDSGLAPRAWRKVVAVGPDGVPPPEAMRSVIIEPLRTALDVRWRAATRLCMAAGAQTRIWLAVVTDADVAYKTLLAVYATADAVGLDDVRLVVRGPRGLGSVAMRAALDAPERATAATPRIWVGTDTVAVDPGVVSCADASRPCAVAPVAAFGPAECARAGIASGGPRDFLLLAADVAARLGDVTRALSACRAVPGSVVVDLPLRLSGDRGATVACQGGRIACAVPSAP